MSSLRNNQHLTSHECAALRLTGSSRHGGRRRDPLPPRREGEEGDTISHGKPWKPSEEGVWIPRVRLSRYVVEVCQRSLKDLVAAMFDFSVLNLNTLTYFNKPTNRIH